MIRWIRAVMLAIALGLAATPMIAVGEQPTGAYHVPPRSGVWWLSKAPRFAEAPTPTVTSTCKSWSGSRTNPYDAIRPNVDTIVEDVINEGSGSNAGCYTPQNETTIAVNPANPDNLVAGANDYRFTNPVNGRNDGSGGYYYSLDRGSTWGNGFLPGLVKGNRVNPGPFDAAGDPVVAFDAVGNVYYANITFNRDSPENGIFVNKSGNGGQTFGAPVRVTYTEDPTILNDKEWIVADTNPRSRNQGAIYVTWTKFEQTPGGTYLRSPILLSRSTDGGQTFSSPVNVSLARNAYNQFSVPVVAPNGDVYVAFQNWPTLMSVNSQILVARSTDGGRSFRSNLKVADIIDFPYNVLTGRAALTGQTFRVNSGPSIAVSPLDGTLYVVWADNRNGTASQTNGDILLSRLRPHDRAWSQPQKINTENGRHDQFFPWVAVDGRGYVHVSFYDRQYVAGGDPADDGYLDYAYTYLADGVTFAPTRKVTTQASDPNTQFDGLFIGDYTAIAADARGYAFLSWTDSRGKPGTTLPNQDAYFHRISPAP